MPPVLRDIGSDILPGMSEQKKPLWPFWVVAGLVLLPVLYVLSIGPLVWTSGSTRTPIWLNRVLEAYVHPLELSYQYGPEWWGETIDAYVDLWD